MSLIDQCACPRCGGALPLRALWLFARTEDLHVLTGLKFLASSGMFKGRIGVECPDCGAKLLLVQNRIRLLLVLLWGSLFGAFALLGSESRSHGVTLAQPLILLIVLGGICIAVLLQRRLMPHFADVRLITDTAGISFPLRAAYEPETKAKHIDASDI